MKKSEIVDVLLIGGTKFLGRAIVDELIDKKHKITLFNRGKTNPDLYPHVETIKGDRDGEISKLGDRTWDAVIDTCGNVPRIVKQSVEHLKGRVNQYIFISSISVYTDSNELNRDETAPVINLENKTTEDIMGSSENYGGLKFLCEEEVRNNTKLPILIRAGLIVGPHDQTNRFTYWPVRIRKGGDILIPENNQSSIQIIDVRDLAKFIVRQVERKSEGVFNVTGPKTPYKLVDIFNECAEFSNNSPNFIAKSNEDLIRRNVTPWMEMPLWLPSENGQALMHVNISKALKNGLEIRPLKETINATLQWYDSIDGDNKEWGAGLAETKEKAILSDPNY